MRKTVATHMDANGRNNRAVAGKSRQKATNASKLCNIVNKIMASKTGEDCAVGSDDEKSDASADNYNIYEWFDSFFTDEYGLYL